jgi:hypothetical protein
MRLDSRSVRVRAPLTLGHLGLNRHGEWLEWDLPTSQKFPKGSTFAFGGEDVFGVPGGAAVWGVSLIPGTSNQQSR